jgi:hypothetical protein|tara:strand:+ start:128 stop:307 length:180 start_codon:yes stop_codon:yes gene_type:complete
MGIYNTQTGKGSEFKGTSISDSRRKYNLKTKSKKKVKVVNMNEITRGSVFCVKLKKAAK